MLSVFEFSVTNKDQFDSITSLMNRRSVDAVLAHEKLRMQRLDDSACCVALADIDNFKAFNDRYGHDVGDLVLAHVAEVFHQHIRRHDTVARFGGEEFLFVLPDMDLDDGIQTIERVREALFHSSIIHNGLALAVTASFGISQLCRHCDIKDSVKRADIALYEAKKAGRNCTVTVDAAAVIQGQLKNVESLTSEQLHELVESLCNKVETV